jgi:hypothetical protein
VFRWRHSAYVLKLPSNSRETFDSWHPQKGESKSPLSTNVPVHKRGQPLKQDTAGCTIPSYVIVVRYEENLLRNRKKVLMAVPDFVHPYGGQQHPLQKINYFSELGRKRS